MADIVILQMSCYLGVAYQSISMVSQQDVCFRLVLYVHIYIRGSHVHFDSLHIRISQNQHSVFRTRDPNIESPKSLYTIAQMAQFDYGQIVFIVKDGDADSKAALRTPENSSRLIRYTRSTQGTLFECNDII